MQVRGQVAGVTGDASGAATVRRLAAEGAPVAVLDLDRTPGACGRFIESRC